MISMFMTGYSCKTIDFAKYSENNRTTIYTLVNGFSLVLIFALVIFLQANVL